VAMTVEGRDRPTAIFIGWRPVPKAQLAASGEGPPRRGHMSPSNRHVWTSVKHL
jgi:hypothetical protein